MPTLEETIAAAPCQRLLLKHPACIAAAVQGWIDGVLQEEAAGWEKGGTADPDDGRYYAGGQQAVMDLRRRLVGQPWDLDLEPAARP